MNELLNILPSLKIEIALISVVRASENVGERENSVAWNIAALAISLGLDKSATCLGLA
jgi:hypothetical protein